MVWGSKGFGVLGFWGLGCFWVLGVGFRLWALGFRVYKGFRDVMPMLCQGCSGIGKNAPTLNPETSTLQSKIMGCVAACSYTCEILGIAIAGP